MRYFSDILVLVCLMSGGLVFGNYSKSAYTYDNLWRHWYAFVGGLCALIFAILWTFRKRKQQQYSFDHFWIIFYGLVCNVICCCFMLTDNLDVAFYFGFLGLGPITLSSYSFLSLRSDSDGSRPARIALGNAIYFTGVTIGFVVYNEFAPQLASWLLLGMTTAAIAGCILNEVLQHFNVHDFKQSHDQVFNLMNDEKLVFLPTKSIYALFAARSDFYVVRNRQWLTVAAAMLMILERLFFYSPTLLQLTWSATFASLDTQLLYLPTCLYVIGCYIGCALLFRYKPKLIYLLFGLIKITTVAAVLGVYAENRSEDCFYLLCIYYISIGIYSSIGLQMLLECSPFLYTELLLTIAWCVELCGLELLKYETLADDNWIILLSISITTMVLTVLCFACTQLLMPPSCGLVEIRNILLGIRRHKSVVPHSKIWQANHFLHHDLQPNALSSVKLPGNRIFLQYPANSDRKLTPERKSKF